MSVLIIFWSILITLSIVWYAGLLFYIGFKGGQEILQMIRDLEAKDSPND